WRALPREIIALLALLAVVVVLLWSHRRPARAAGARAGLPRFYARALRTLRRRGLCLHDGETAREFARRVETAVPACAEPLARLTAAYERVRFGLRPLTLDEAAAVDQSVLELRRRGPALRPQ